MKHPQRQHGATLLVTMIMLIMLTLFALSAMNTSITNLRMVGNMQNRAEAFDATQNTIQTVISSTRFVDFPANAIEDNCGAPNTMCTDLNGDGNPDLTTTLNPAPQCIRSKVTKVSELTILGPNSEDVACLQAQAQGTFAVVGALTSGDSLCGQTIWNITATTLQSGVAANVSDVSYTATQGVGVRVRALDIAYSCP